MRILAITNLYPNPLQPNRGTFNRQQFRALAARNEVTVIAPVAWTDEWALKRRGATSLSADRRICLDGLVVHHPRYVFPPKVLRNRYGEFFRRSIRPVFDRLLADFRPDAVLAAWAYPDGWAAVELAKEAGLPVVVKVHGSDVLVLAREGPRRTLTANALAGADGVLAVSRDLAAHALEMGVDPRRVRVIYDGVDTQTFCPGSRHEARARIGVNPQIPLVLFVGNLVSVKGLNVLMEACARLPARCEFKCCLIGAGPMRRQLEAVIRQLRLDGRVELIGSKPHHELPDWFRAADVFVLPSFSEGVPCVLLEAAACGVPFVASRVGGIPEIAHLGPSSLVPPGDPAALADAILRRLISAGPPEGDYPSPRTHNDAALEIAEFIRDLVNWRNAKRGVPSQASERQPVVASL